MGYRMKSSLLYRIAACLVFAPLMAASLFGSVATAHGTNHHESVYDESMSHGVVQSDHAQAHVDTQERTVQAQNDADCLTHCLDQQDDQPALTYVRVRGEELHTVAHYTPYHELFESVQTQHVYDRAPLPDTVNLTDTSLRSYTTIARLE